MGLRAGLVLVCAHLLLAQPAARPSLDAAAEAYQQGRIADARGILEALLKAEPKDAGALVLMGAVLDAEQRYQEAEPYYRRALEAAPSSPQALNNAANHYLAAGDRQRARDLYLKTVAVDPRHTNANLQLAQMSIDDKQGRPALQYLDRSGAGSEPAVVLLRARALALAGRCQESAALLNGVTATPVDAAVSFSTGMAYAGCGVFDRAETSFSRALDADPRNFDILYNLGLASLRAGHVERAREVLEKALHEKPGDTDTLYTLAQVLDKQRSPLNAAALLARAEKISPDRADVELLLAQVSAELEFFEDAAGAYDRYLKLKPDDDVARRERGFNRARGGQLKEALRDLQWYTGRHPRDAVGYFELAVARIPEDREAALQLLDRSIALDPALYQVRYTRALLRLEDGRAAAAIPDLEAFVANEPDHVEALARLGQAYLSADRAGDALKALERAQTLSPDSPLVLVNYRRALVKAGRSADATAVLKRLHDAGNRAPSRRHVGLIDYLDLSPEDRGARLLANLRQNSAADPGNLPLRIALARALVAAGRKQEGVDTLRELASADLTPALRAQCGRMLLELDRFEDARAFLERALAASPGSAEARLDLAIALFRMHDPTAALHQLDKEPPPALRGDYELVRAQILDAEGKVPEAAAALNRGIHAAPTRAALYYQATSFLLKHKLHDEARTLLEQASRILPDDRELQLAQVVVLDLLRQAAKSESLLAKVQARWPEWERPYLIKGILLELNLNSAEARQALETAIALGARTPEAYYYDALAITHAAPEDLDAAHNAITKAVALTSKDPYVYLLAGKIALARRDYGGAVDALARATALHPSLIAAHYGLREAYTALGDRKKAADEVELVKHIAAETEGTGISPFSMEDVLFTVRAPE